MKKKFITILNAYLKANYPYSPYYFALWRLSFGGYMLFYSLTTMPYVVMLYSNDGFYKYYEPLWFLPTILTFDDSPVVVLVLGFSSIACAFAIMVGWYRVWAAGILWFIQLNFLFRNILTEDPSTMFIGLLLLMLILIPEGEPWSVKNKSNTEWYMPLGVYWCVLLAMGVGYTISGIQKLQSISWQNGEALYLMLQLPIIKDNIVVGILQLLPPTILTLLTWFVLISMLFTLPFLILHHTRLLIWSIITVMFIGVYFVFELNQVVLGMLLVSAFVFDKNWFKRKIGRDVPQPINPISV